MDCDQAIDPMKRRPSAASNGVSAYSALISYFSSPYSSGSYNIWLLAVNERFVDLWKANCTGVTVVDHERRIGVRA